MLFVTQFISSSGLGSFAERVTKKAKEIVKLIRASKSNGHLSESHSFSGVKFENVKIQRKENYIFYFGPVSDGLTIFGFMDFEGNGEEVYIKKSNGDKKRGHKVIMYKTMLDYKTLRSDYFTKATLHNLLRTRLS